MTQNTTKLIFCIRRLPHLSPEQFKAYWHDVHAPIVRERAAVLGIQRYVQQHALGDHFSKALADKRGAPPAYDGIAELWFDSRGAQTDAQKAAARQANAELLADERNFIDLAASPMFFVQEVPILHKDQEGAIHDFLESRRSGRP